MKALIIYDSNYGNTEKIARAIASAFDDVGVVNVANYNEKMLRDVSLIIVGSPINGWRPTKKIDDFLGQINLGGIKATAFDTRIRSFISGDAAKKIERKLSIAGATIVDRPHSYIVQGTEGPLLDGEIEKAKEWSKSLLV